MTSNIRNTKFDIYVTIFIFIINLQWLVGTGDGSGTVMPKNYSGFFDSMIDDSYYPEQLSGNSRMWSPFVSASNNSCRDKGLQFTKRAEGIANLRTIYNKTLASWRSIKERPQAATGQNGTTQGAPGLFPGSESFSEKEDFLERDLQNQAKNIDLLQEMLDQDMRCSEISSSSWGQVRHALNLVMAGNNPNINTLVGSIAHRCFQPLAKTIDEKGRLFWGWVFDKVHKFVQVCFLKVGWGAVLTEENINLLENVAEIIKQQLDLQAKYASESFGNEKSFNSRLAKDDRIGCDEKQEVVKSNELIPLLNLVTFALEETDLYLYKYKRSGKSLTTEAKLLGLINVLFKELREIFTAAELLKNMQASVKLSQAMCVHIVALCKQLLKPFVLNKAPSKRPAAYDFLSQREDKFG